MITFTEIIIGAYFGVVTYAILLILLGFASIVYMENYYRR
jgi:hypothetical protein